MLSKNEYLICFNLHKELKERIKGKVFLTFNNGTLTININMGREIRYTRYINDIPKTIDIEHLADDIEYGYRKFITDHYFIRKEAMLKW